MSKLVLARKDTVKKALDVQKAAKYPKSGRKLQNEEEWMAQRAEIISILRKLHKEAKP